MLTLPLIAFAGGCAAIDRIVAGPDPAPFVSEFCIAVEVPTLSPSTPDWLRDNDPQFLMWVVSVDEYGRRVCKGWGG